jgi:hypothetical protein
MAGLQILGEAEQELTIPANSASTMYFSFQSQTLISTTFYIENTSNIPLTGTILTMNIVDWRTSQQNIFNLTAYRYGEYIENYPIGQIFIQNVSNAAVQLYIQYTIKQYSDVFNPTIQDLTQLVLVPSVITQSLTPTTNFRYFGALLNLTMSGFPIGGTIYVLDQQVIGTSASASGFIGVPWTSNYTEPINVAALGASEDDAEYIFTVDSTTIQVPTNITATNAVMNWVNMDFFSPLGITITSGNSAILFNASTGEFECDNNISLSYWATYLPALGAPLTNITNSVM